MMPMDEMELLRLTKSIERQLGCIMAMLIFGAACVILKAAFWFLLTPLR